MKQITMDYDEYIKEKKTCFETGYEAGLSRVIEWLESGETITEFLNIPLDKMSYYWERIEKLLEKKEKE